MATRFGVDVGGTFTDLIFYDESTREIRVGKVPTTPASPDEGVLDAVRAAVPEALLGEVEYFLHGTTVGLNSLLTRSGAVVGIISTKGFSDVLEIRRGDREDVYDAYWRQPDPLVPRNLRIGVRERILATGEIADPLNEDEVRAAAKQLEEAGANAIAVVFISAYANPEHELRAEQLIRDAGFNGEISLSHRTSGEYREYERTSTTVVDAYVRGRMARYLQRLDKALGSVGVEGRRLLTRSGGGAMTFGEAEARPFETIMSGPVAGAEGAAELARLLDLGDVITADVGGTSFDTALIVNGRPRLEYEGKVAGQVVQSPWVDVRSIGAGGGSIAHVDIGGLLNVGPASAGAVPGPACYGLGGTEPTVTDAALLLGMLGERRLASGVTLQRELAEAAMSPLAEVLGLSLDDVARGTLTIANANMANAIRGITIEQGQDPRATTLMPFGGAGPLFGCLLARELEIASILLPPYAGNFSAWGLLGADLTQTVARTQIVGLDADGLVKSSELAAELFEEVGRRRADSHDGGAAVREVRLDMRYAGQEHTITAEVPLGSDGKIDASPQQVFDAFVEEYRRTFGETLEGAAAEIVSVRATVRVPLPERDFGTYTAGPSAGGGNGPGTLATSVSAYSFAKDDWLDFALVDRAGLGDGDEVAGPAILIEETATTYLDADFRGRVGRGAAMFITDTTQEA